MKVTTKQTDIAFWHYACPECGFGNAETGYHAPDHMIYCEVCLEDDRRVKLRRWPADAGSTPSTPGGLSGR